MDLFDKIDQFEKKVANNIQDKLTMFIKVIEDLEIFIKTQKDKEKELNIDKNVIGIINEIKTSNKLTKTIIEHNKLIKTIQKEKVINSSPVSVYKNFPNQETINIFNIDHINYFNQNFFKNCKKYYHRTNETKLIKQEVIEFISKTIREKMYTKFLENKNNKKKVDIKIKKENKDNIDDIDNKDNKDNKNSLSFNETFFLKTTKDFFKVNKYKRFISPETRLYTKPPKHKEILTENFVIEKIFEYRFNGGLQKKIDLKEVVKKFKIKEKKDLNDINLNHKMDLTSRVVNDYITNRNNRINPIKKLSVINNNEKITRDVFVTKIDRNNIDLQISKILYFVNIVDLKRRDKDNTYLNNHENYLKKIKFNKNVNKKANEQNYYDDNSNSIIN